MKKIILSIFLSFIFLFLLSGCIINLAFDFVLIGDDNITLNPGEEYFENGYKAYFFNKPFNNVEIRKNINNSKAGKYTVEYIAKIVFIKKKIVRTVIISDIQKPNLTLTGDNYIYLNKYEVYADPGYVAIDNVDGDITDKVSVSSNLDVNKLGKYQITYSVEDASGNQSTIIREVEVINNNILLSNIKDFTLKGLFSDIVLNYENKEYAYFKETIFLGDSNVLYLNTRGNYISKQQTWGRNNLNIAQINSSFFTSMSDKKNISLKETLEKYQPKYLIVSVGINSPLYMKKTNYIKEIEKFIEFMRNDYPNISFAFSSILPITSSGTLDPGIQKKINEFNYYLAETCYNNKVNYINFSDEIRDKSGYGNEKYFDCRNKNDCGFHLSNLGKEKYIDYIKHLNLKRRIVQ